jgi:excisionase family DNA binding protein
MPNSNLLNTLQAAQLLGCHPDTLRLWRKQGRGPKWFKIGHRYRYSQDAINAFLDVEAQQ